MTGPPSPSPAPPGSAHFPLPAMVGGDDVLLALVLCAIDPGIGGVLLRGEKGSGKTTAARGLAALLPGTAPFVELPLGAGEDRVVGTFDLRAALGSGEHRFQPGLLAQADGGVLYVDEVNLLADHLVDVLLDAAATGVNRVERDGLSEVHPARFVLVGSMNPEEGELRPQLLDRFGLSVAVRAPADPLVRAEAVRRRMAFDADRAGFALEWEEAVDALRARLGRARPAPLAEGLEELVAAVCAGAGAEGLRADLVTCRAAAALAGWEGRAAAVPDDVRRVAPLVLAHRRAVPWSPSPAASSPSSGAPSALDDLVDRALGEGSARRPPPAAGPHQLDDGAGTGVSEPVPGAGAGAGSLAAAPPPGPLPQPVAPTGLLDPARTGRTRHDQRASTAAGRRSRSASANERGREVGARPPDAGSAVRAVAPRATVAAAAQRRPSVAGNALVLADVDLREPVYQLPNANLVVLVVDASGSMGARERVAAARDAVASLLVDVYQRRDRVAVVTFRGEGAEVVLRPTGSTEVARARLAEVPTGGRTPLAAGIDAGRTLASAGAGPGLRPFLVLVSDGRATVGAGRADPVDAALRAARGVRAAGIDALVVDCEGRAPRLGVAALVAEEMGARCVAADSLDGAALAGAVRAGLSAAPVPGR